MQIASMLDITYVKKREKGGNRCAPALEKCSEVCVAVLVQVHINAKWGVQS